MQGFLNFLFVGTGMRNVYFVIFFGTGTDCLLVYLQLLARNVYLFICSYWHGLFTCFFSRYWHGLFACLFLGTWTDCYTCLFLGTGTDCLFVGIGMDCLHVYL